jgi:hypothetical protein
VDNPRDSNGEPIYEGDYVFYPSNYFVEDIGLFPSVGEGRVIKVKAPFCKITIKDNKTNKMVQCWPKACIKERIK